MCGVPCGGDGADDRDASGPGQGTAAIGSDGALVFSVVDFVQRCQDGAARVAVGRQDAGHVLDDEDAALADLAQQAAGCPLNLLAAGVADSSAPSLAMVLVTCALAPSNDRTTSV